MPSMPQAPQSRIIFLTGAPAPGRVQRAIHSASVPNSFIPAVRRFLDLDDADTCRSNLTNIDESSLANPKWRCVPHSANDARAALEQHPRESDLDGNPLFLSEGPGEAQSSSEQDPFLEHSYSLFTQSTSENTPPAIITTELKPTPSDLSFTTTTSTSFDSSAPRPPAVHLPAPIRPLASLPSAAHVRSCAPQTITAHLLVGVISASAPRSVALRRRPRRPARSMDIVELLVGDDTSAGFAVTFWLDPVPPAPGPSAAAADEGATGLRAALRRVRARDVLLLRNVALGVFRGRVHGQSLNARVCLNETTVEVLDGEGRRGGDVVDEDPEGAGMMRVEKVTDWVLAFLGARESVPERVVGEVEEELPPDTLVA